MYCPGNFITEILTDSNVLANGTAIPHDGSIEYISNNDFYACDNLATVHFTRSLKCIENDGFINCPKLKEVIFHNADINFSMESFQYCPNFQIRYLNSQNVLILYQFINSEHSGEYLMNSFYLFKIHIYNY